MQRCAGRRGGGALDLFGRGGFTKKSRSGAVKDARRPSVRCISGAHLSFCKDVVVVGAK